MSLLGFDLLIFIITDLPLPIRNQTSMPYTFATLVSFIVCLIIIIIGEARKRQTKQNEIEEKE